MIIIGAGMAGLLAAHMLRRFSPVIKEAAPSLPNNHDALLRFRTDAVSRATGIPFKKVWVHKAICHGGELHSKTNIRFSNMYSAKVTGRIASRSILNLDSAERYVAPPDFIRQLAVSCNIEYGSTIKSIGRPHTAAVPIISTMPMPTLMKMVEWKDIPEFNHQAITTISCIIDATDVYQTLYYPSDTDQPYRASITGNKLMIEIMGDDPQSRPDVIKIISQVMFDFGIYNWERSSIQISTQKYGKIIPTDDPVRKQFILAMTDLHNVYSVGRFGTWRQILMDDVVCDIQLVEQMISERSAYTQRLRSL